MRSLADAKLGDGKEKGTMNMAWLIFTNEYASQPEKPPDNPIPPPRPENEPPRPGKIPEEPIAPKPNPPRPPVPEPPAPPAWGIQRFAA